MKEYGECIAIYGKVRIARVFCEACGIVAMVIRGKLACCDADATKVPGEHKRFSNPALVRKLPPVAARRAMLAEQNNCCYWCGCMFGSTRRYHGRLRKLKLHWDHLLPWSFSQNNDSSNFVASCSLCNLIKHDKVFLTTEECREYIEKRINDSYLQDLRREIRDEEKFKGVL